MRCSGGAAQPIWSLDLEQGNVSQCRREPAEAPSRWFRLRPSRAVRAGSSTPPPVPRLPPTGPRPSRPARAAAPLRWSRQRSSRAARAGRSSPHHARQSRPQQPAAGPAHARRRRRPVPVTPMPVEGGEGRPRLSTWMILR